MKAHLVALLVVLLGAVGAPLVMESSSPGEYVPSSESSLVRGGQAGGCWQYDSSTEFVCELVGCGVTLRNKKIRGSYKEVLVPQACKNDISCVWLPLSQSACLSE